MRQIFIALILSTALITLNPDNVQSQSRQTLCVKYEVKQGYISGWSKGYKVEVTTMSGSELNRRTNSRRYNGLSQYAIIFWREGEATVIRLNAPFLNYSSFGTYGNDQQDRRWQLTTNTLLCY
jgi:hypothetical protein